MGDLNTRLHGRKLEETHIIGPHIIGMGVSYLQGTDSRPPSRQPNREHLLQLANEEELVIANTFKTPKFEHRASFRELATKRGTPIFPESYTQLDHMLTVTRWLPTIASTRTFPFQEWDSNHYMFLARIRVRLGAVKLHNTPHPKLVYKLPTPAEQESANNSFNDKIQALLANNPFAPLVEQEAQDSDTSDDDQAVEHVRSSAGWGGSLSSKY